MRKIITITSYEINEQIIQLCSNDTSINITEGKDTKQMLVDSDQTAFIYIIECDEEYVYIEIPHACWKGLKQLLLHNYQAVLQVGNQRLQLENMKEELEYLINNIEGNTNYGDEMVSKVEEIFLTN
ncbi:hypothetical protein [Cytobacillus sp. IB215316]|uniref:UPF0738 family protein n=1 Tax=Cytobacillus sp. IB215316 TaxID=3097354 RepID=UPI002A176DDB|nr:hypothetical protein [Cytobacillus sp. IB215316]MDX8362548.1 hypothetical protein [Cytobacillus sp. IB215316]